MKDLKHLLFFENLLMDADNELIEQAKKDGNRCIAYTCENVPEPLLNLAGCFGVRLRAPRTSSVEMSTYYLTSLLCEYSRALLERALEGGFNFADAVVSPDGCSMMNRCIENMELLNTMNEGKKDFFYEFMEIPMKADDNGLNLYVLQCKNHILKPLAEKFGIDTSDEALLKAVKEHNHLCDVIRAIGDYRKEDNPRITGYEFHIITMATYIAPYYLIIDKLEETLEELKTRKPDAKNPWRVRVLLAGSEIDDMDYVKLVESCGAYVCADRFCMGSLPGRVPIEIDESKDILTQVCEHYMSYGQCPRYMNTAKMDGRRKYINDLAEEYRADGVIYEQIKFCDPWAYERMLGGFIVENEYKHPVLSIDRPYMVSTAAGQMRTRVQAFVESIEIKKIQKGAK